MSLPRGSLVLVDLEPTLGHEQRGTRPCLVVSDPAVNASQRFPEERQIVRSIRSSPVGAGSTPAPATSATSLPAPATATCAAALFPLQTNA
jgi:hypothetical protein